jgi:hypothetical protein
MESNVDNKILSAIQIVARKVNDLFARKNHTHTRENIGIRFSPVAFSGNYGDLIGTPQQQNIGVATSTTPGIVTSGKGITISSGGMVNVLTNAKHGLYVDNENGVSLNMGTGMINYNNQWCSSITLRCSGWHELANQLGEIVNKCLENGMCLNMTVTIVNMASNIDTFMRVILTSDLMNNYLNIRNYVRSILSMIEDREGLSIPVCCEGFDEICDYEFLKIISECNVYDAAVLYIFKNSRELDRNDMRKCLGMIVPDTVSVVEYQADRFERLGIEPAPSSKFATTYVFTNNGFGDESYAPLRRMISDLYGRS